MADIDADGDDDLISGSWPGEIFLFRRGPDGEFSAPEKVKDTSGKSINIGGGIMDRGADGMLLVAGDARFEETEDGRFIVYEGERIEIKPGQEAGITGTASSVGVADWDGDGDFDLLVGDIRGNVWLVPNEGSAQSYAFGTEQHLRADGRELVVAGDAGPFAADWDGDGDLDLLVGDGQGAVTLYRNIGDRSSPELAAGRVLVPRSTVNYSDPPDEPTPGMRTKLCAADWDGDGDLDLLVGDYTIQKVKHPPFTPEEEAEHARLRDKLTDVEERYRELVGRLYGPPGERPPDGERKELQEQMSEIVQEMQSIREKLPQERENHGWVWLYERRTADQAVGSD